MATYTTSTAGNFERSYVAEDLHMRREFEEYRNHMDQRIHKMYEHMNFVEQRATKVEKELKAYKRSSEGKSHEVYNFELRY